MGRPLNTSLPQRTNRTRDSDMQQTMTIPPQHRAPHPYRGKILASCLVLVAFLIGLAIGEAGHTAEPVKVRTVTRIVPSPIPGPTVYRTVTAPPPAPGTAIGTWSGTGNAATPAFNAPASGDYTVSWTFSNNDDSNFAITATDSNAAALGLPNVIQSSGSGSTEVTGASGTESFDVMATGNWTIKAVTAP
jgi:hypothetical protein